ncbi:MAG: T9SS type A sorting domain-containing protein [Candidatus Kapaibacterium sp.]
MNYDNTYFRTQMKAKFVAVLVGVATLTGYATAQVNTDVEITISNAAEQSRTLHCGVNTSATVGVDTELGELSLPPFPPTSAFEGRFVSHESGVLGQGSPSDFRPSTSVEQSDAYKIKFQPGTNGMPVTLRWDMEYVKKAYSSATLSDPFGGVIVSVDMKTVGSLEITNAALSEVVLQLNGPVDPSLAVEVGEEKNLRFLIEPEVADGRITLNYSLAVSTRLSLSIVDLQGRVVETLFPSRDVEAGVYSDQFDLSHLSSGLYILVVRTEESVVSRNIEIVR